MDYDSSRMELCASIFFRMTHSRTFYFLQSIRKSFELYRMRFVGRVGSFIGELFSPASILEETFCILCRIIQLGRFYI